MSSMELRVEESCSDRSEEIIGSWICVKRRGKNVRFEIVNVDGFERAVMNDRALSSWTNV